MNNIARSKIFMIVGAVIMALLVVAVILVAIFIPRENENVEEVKTVEQLQKEEVDNYFAGENGNEEAADVLESELGGETPPHDMYENSYENDFGYQLLSDHESAADNPENTVYDPVWAGNKWVELNCDLSTKRTVSAKALQPLQWFKSDLRHVDTDYSRQLITNVDFILNKLGNSRGNRMPGEVLDITLTNCELLTEIVGV